jgi:hypothetical protein
VIRWMLLFDEQMKEKTSITLITDKSALVLLRMLRERREDRTHDTPKDPA